MFFKQKAARNRRVAPAEGPALSPRFERLLRESRWLLVLAVLGYLALVLASYTKTDPGWSFSGTGAPVGNRGGDVGAWLADLLLYLFGLSAWWLVVAGIGLAQGTSAALAAPSPESFQPTAFPPPWPPPPSPPL